MLEKILIFYIILAIFMFISGCTYRIDSAINETQAYPKNEIQKLNETTGFPIPQNQLNQSTTLTNQSTKTSNETIVIKPLECYYDNTLCNTDEFCLKNICIKKSTILPKNAKSSQTNCNYDEVYRNGKCEKAKVNVMFIQNDLTNKQEFNDWIDKAFATFIYVSPLKNCPDTVRIHRNFTFCASKKSSTQHMDYAIKLNFTSVFIVLPSFGFNYTEEERNCLINNNFQVDGYISIKDNAGSFTHELSHSLGLWDQYCYLPNPQNPNPTDFNLGECKPAEDNWFKSYCSRDILGHHYTQPYVCTGDPNPFGGITVMSYRSYSYEEAPTFGYSQKEFDYLSRTLKCT